MNDPVGESVIHHSCKVHHLYAVAVKMNAAGRAVKSEIEYAVVPFAEQIQVVLELFASIASQVAELRFHA